jgi:hypothetical protein
VQVHHARQGRGEPHAVGDGAVAVKPDHLVLLGDVVQKTGIDAANVDRGLFLTTLDGPQR